MKYCKRYHDVIEQFKLSCKFCSAGLFLFFSFLQETEKKRYLCKEFCLHTASAAPHAANAPRELIRV